MTSGTQYGTYGSKIDQKGTSGIFKSSVYITLQDDLNNINIRKKLAAGL